jgi:hypothetical protein
MTVIRKRALFLGLVALTGLAGCGQVHEANPAPITSTVDLVTFSGNWPATQQILDNAVRVLDRKCMATHGFGYPDTPLAKTMAPEDEAAVIDLPDRRQHGYQIVATSAPTLPAEAVNPYLTSLSPANQQRYRAALFGPPGTDVTPGIAGGYVVKGQGCEADSRRALAGSVQQWARITYIPQQLNDHLVEQVTTQPRYIAAMTAWQACMATRGYSYPTPQHARSALQSEYLKAGPTQQFRERETAVAVADGECAGAVHLPLVSLAVRRDLVQSLPAPDRATLADLASIRDTAVARAVSALDD